MKICAVICEYNPFHNGHKYHIELTKALHGVTHMIGVMSGNFTQRGDIAIYNKWQRTETALLNGIDLIVELPVAFSIASAEYFSIAAITILNKMNCVDILSFGSECGEIELLEETAGAVHFAEEQEEFFQYMRRGDSYPAALQKTVAYYYEEIISEVLSTPNNTLAIEYLKAINETGSIIKPVTIKRKGAPHDSETKGENGTISASKLRKMIYDNDSAAKTFTPFDIIPEYAQPERLELPILSKLRSMTTEDFLKTPNVIHGLENRIYKASRDAGSLAELLLLTKTKNYTMSRIRRIVLNSFLGITKKDLRTMPSYIRVLGMNGKGREILRKAKGELPIDTSLMALSKKSDSARRQAYLESATTDQYGLCFNAPYRCGLDFTHKPIIIDK